MGNYHYSSPKFYINNIDKYRFITNDEDYYVSYKANLSSQANYVLAVLPGAELSGDLVFRENTKDGMIISPINDELKDGKRELKLTLTGATEKILVYDSIFFSANGINPDTTIFMQVGQLNVTIYKKKNRKIVFVPVNETDAIAGGQKIGDMLTAIRDSLNSIYKPAEVEWTTDTIPGITVNSALDGMDDSDNNIITNYTSEMNDVINTFKAEHNSEDDTYYMFVVKKDSASTKDGYMPFGHQFGFLIVDGTTTQENLIRTIGHEIGHGAFKLFHTFSDRARYPLDQAGTDNLMDYVPDTRLFQYQWDMIDDPAFFNPWFLSEEEMAGKGFLIKLHVENENNINPSPEKKLQVYFTISEILKKMDLSQPDKKVYINDLNVLFEIKDSKSNDLLYTSLSPINIPTKSGVFYWDGKMNYESYKDIQINKEEHPEIIVTAKYYWLIPPNYIYKQSKFLRYKIFDNKPNFDWMHKIDLNAPITQEVLDLITSNLNGINDRTDASIYPMILKPKSTGFVYNGINKGSPIVPGNDFEKEMRTKILEEFETEGRYSAINTWDDNNFTWGKGWAMGGALPDFIKHLYLQNPQYKQIFYNVGIKTEIIKGSLQFCYLDSKGKWILGDENTSHYFKNNKQILSFFIELAEKEDYYQQIINAQADALFFEGAGKLPVYIMNNARTAYEENWNEVSVPFIAHLSHWAGAGWHVGYSYADTKGDIDKILYKYVYNSAKSAGMKSRTLESNIYVWNSVYNILRFISQSCSGIGKTTLDTKWNAHTVEIEFNKDANEIERAVVKDIYSGFDKYITNTECVLIKVTGNQYIVLTKNAEAITYENF